MSTNLQNMRQSKKLSQRQLADRSGVSWRVIQHYEQGVTDINKAQAANVYKLAKALHCKMESLIDTEAESCKIPGGAIKDERTKSKNKRKSTASKRNTVRPKKSTKRK